MKHVTVRVALSFLFVIFAFGALAAQNAAGASAQSSSNQQQPPSAQQQPQNPDTAAGEELTGAASGEVGEENAQFKYSKSVIWMGHLLGLGSARQLPALLVC